MTHTPAVTDAPQNVNFIKHLRAVHLRLVEDGRISSKHLSLYWALFMTWNQSRFRTSMAITRSEVMHEARIGSLKTYTKCMYELQEWGYLAYEPTFDSNAGTKVCMYRFDKANLEGHDNDARAATDSNFVNDQEAQHEVEPVAAVMTSAGHRKHTRTPQHTGDTGGVPRSLDEVSDYFAEQKFGLVEARKFYNYYQMTGWVSGRSHTPIRNWRAAAETWMLRVRQDDGQLKPRPGASHVRIDKDYNQPL